VDKKVVRAWVCSKVDDESVVSNLKVCEHVGESMAGLFGWIAYKLSKDGLAKVNVDFHKDILVLEELETHGNICRRLLMKSADLSIEEGCLGVIESFTDEVVDFRMPAVCLALLEEEQGWLLPLVHHLSSELRVEGLVMEETATRASCLLFFFLGEELGEFKEVDELLSSCVYGLLRS
jgi:hypothetical protein